MDSTRKKTVLIVEDVPEVSRLTQILLEREGFETLVAPSLAQAKDIISNFESRKIGLDIIICDMNLPDGQGANLLKWKKINLIDTPTVMYSAEVNFQNPGGRENYKHVKPLHDLGAVSVLKKGNDFNRLLPLVAHRFAAQDYSYHSDSREVIVNMTDIAGIDGILFDALAKYPVISKRSTKELFARDGKTVPVGFVLDSQSVAQDPEILLRIPRLFPYSKIAYMGDVDSMAIGSKLNQVRALCPQSIDELLRGFDSEFNTRNVMLTALQSIPRQIALLAGPSGSGKDTLSNYLVSALPYWEHIVTDTSRARREYEIDGVHHNFKPLEQMRANRKDYLWLYESVSLVENEGKLVEEVVMYGITRAKAYAALASGKSVLVHVKSLAGLNSFNDAFGIGSQSTPPNKILLLKQEEEAIAASYIRNPNDPFSPDAVRKEMRDFIENHRQFEWMIPNPTYEMLQTNELQVHDMRLDAAANLISFLKKSVR